MFTGKLWFTHFVNHITFRMPAFVAHISVDFNKLFEDGTVASCAFSRETS
jgi:hypothetical protein